jgi:hypothetical protein
MPPRHLLLLTIRKQVQRLWRWYFCDVLTECIGTAEGEQPLTYVEYIGTTVATQAREGLPVQDI